MCSLIVKLGDAARCEGSRVPEAIITCMWDVNDDLREAAVHELKGHVAAGDQSVIKLLRESFFLRKHKPQAHAR